MRDVAELAGGVHPSTVSLVLRNSPNISDATRRRVLAAVRKTGYRRDPMLDAYNQHRTGMLPHRSEPVIAWISDLESRDELEGLEPCRSFWRGARAAAESLHCKLEPFLCGRTQLSPERLNGILRARGISALVVMAFRPGAQRLAFGWEEFSAVKVESPHLPQPGFMVASDRRQAARLAFRRLSALGYRRIGLLAQPSRFLGDSLLLRSGCLIEQASLPAAERVPPLLLEDSAAAVSLVAAWVQQKELDVVLVDDASLLSLVPRQRLDGARLAYASLDVVGAPEGVAGVRPEHERVGAQAVEQVVSLMRANQRGLAGASSSTFIPCTWIDGPSAPAR
jgi:LacI family transcriptional regulator